MKRIAVVGVGLLGSAVASRLLQGGFQVAGYDTRPEVLQALAGAGLRAADSIADAVRDAELVFTVLPSLEAAEAVMSGAGGLCATAARGTVVCQMSTISPELARRLGEAAEGAGMPFLDTPISGTSAMVARGDSTLLVGGDAVLAERCQPVFSAVSARTVHMGPVGAATLAKLVTNLLVALNTAALAEALVLGEKGGLKADKMLELLSHSAAASRMMDIRGPLMAAGDYPPQMKLDLFLKDIRLMMEAGERLGVALPLTGTAQQLYQQASLAGLDGKDLAVVKTELERMAGMAKA
ncbi:MAG TPA: NAD(P)-dependent oxidoreductase [bacterium]|nr:NAD(P)-dependent oxidoreductase [bacterium]